MTPDQRRVTCDSCGTTLPLPTTPEASAGWERHSISRDGRLHFAYSCPGPKCAETTRQLLARETRR